MIDWLRRDPDALAVRVGDIDLPLVIRRHPRARRMTLRLANDGEAAQVTLPRWGRTAEALAFAQSRSAWLARQRDARPARITIEPGATIRFRGAPLRIDWRAEAPRRPVRAADRLALGGPPDALEARVRRWLRDQARMALEADLADYADRAGLPLAPLALSNARRRWGSCSGDGAIRMNWRLIQAPDAVRRSVVAHETAHRLHFDHSPAFHAALARLYEGDIAEADRWLRDHGRTLYAAFP